MNHDIAEVCDVVVNVVASDSMPSRCIVIVDRTVNDLCITIIQADSATLFCGHITTEYAVGNSGAAIIIVNAAPVIADG